MPAETSWPPLPPISLFLLTLAGALLGLAFLVIKAAPRARANRSLAWAALAVAAWVVGVSGLQTGAHLQMWLALAFSGSAFIPATLLSLARYYPVATASPRFSLRAVSYVSAILFSYCSLATSLLFSRPRVVDGMFLRDPGPLYPLFVSYFVIAWFVVLIALCRKASLATPRQGMQLRYFVIGLTVSTAGGMTTNLFIPYVTGNSAYNWLGPCFVVSFIMLVAHSIIRHHLMDLRLVLHRNLLRVFATAASLVPLLIVLSLWGTRSESGVSGGRLAFMGAILLAGLLVPLVRDMSLRLMDHYVYRPRANYRRTVKESSALLTRVQNVGSLLTATAARVTEAMGAEGVVIYLCEGDSSARAVVHPTMDGRFTPPDALPAIVSQALKTGPHQVLGQGAASGDRRTESLRDTLHDLDWSLVLPLISDDTIIGAMAIGPKLSGDPYYPQDLDLLATLANHAGIAVKNAQLYAEVVLANEYVENIVATINSGVVAVNAAGRVTLFNRAAEHLTGLGAADVRAQPTGVLPTCLSEPLTRVVAEGQAVTCPEIALPGRTTAARPVICTVSPLRDTAGRILGGVAVFSDLTPLKELEISRRRAERLDYFKSLASGFAHEIKNPLVSIKTFVQLVPHRLGDTRWLEEFSQVVQREIERLERLLQRLATLGRSSERPQRLLDLRIPLREALELLQPEFAQRHINVAAHFGEAKPTMLGDHDELKQLAHNLLINALQHTPVGGVVTVELKAADGRVTMTVADTGPGIPAELMERVFDPFVTTRTQGTGLGLAICTGIAAAHRGRIQAVNQTGGGAALTVEFPLATGVLAAAGA
jgi:PAS domain S-box-containing protein